MTILLNQDAAKTARFRAERFLGRMLDGKDDAGQRAVLAGFHVALISQFRLHAPPVMTPVGRVRAFMQVSADYFAMLDQHEPTTRPEEEKPS